MPPRDAQLPLEALRDLVGIVRALFAAWTKARVGPLELEELLHIGRELRAALNLASKTQPGTVGHRAAWSRVVPLVAGGRRRSVGADRRRSHRMAASTSAASSKRRLIARERAMWTRK